MRSVQVVDNVVPFRRPAGLPQPGRSGLSGMPASGRARADQRNLMDIVYGSGSFVLAAEDRETKLVASRLQVYGFLVIEEIGEDGDLRRLRPSEAIRARAERPWRLSKASYGAGLAVTIPAADGFLFEPSAMPLDA